MNKKPSLKPETRPCPCCDGRGHLLIRQSKRAACATWLIELLSDGIPRKSSKVIELAEQDGHKRTMVYRARQDLKNQIANTRPSNNDPHNEWQIIVPADR